MVRSCANHADREAPTACFHCRKPVCAACTVLAPDGSFCSAECGVVWRALREKPEENPALRKAGRAAAVLGILLAFIVALVAVHAAALRGSVLAKRIDLLGRVFDGFHVLKNKGTPK